MDPLLLCRAAIQARLQRLIPGAERVRLPRLLCRAAERVL